MNKRVFYRLLIVMVLLPLALAAADYPECYMCGKKITRRYLTDRNKRMYCSRGCFDKSLPRCANCRQVCRGRFLVNKDKYFCSKKCADEMLLPRCHRCGKGFTYGRKLQVAYGEFVYCQECSALSGCLVCERPEKSMRQYSNGHYLCIQCNKNVISNKADLERHFRKVRAFLVQHLRFRNDHVIKLKMRHFELGKKDQNGNVSREFGLYSYSGKEIYTKPLAIEFWRKKQTTVRYENESCTIEIMNDLPAFKAEEVIAHELAHDYMKHRWYYIKDLTLREGFAELVSAEYNRLTGNGRWNYRMQNNPDPVYGNGYRLLKSYFDKGSWAEVERQLDAANYRAMPDELKQK